MKASEKNYIDLKRFLLSDFLFTKNDSDWFNFIPFLKILIEGLWEDIFFHSASINICLFTLSYCKFERHPQ